MNYTLHNLESCRIVIHNEVTGKNSLKVSPQSVHDAMNTDGDVQAALDYVEWQQALGNNDPNASLAAVVTKYRDTITIRWHVTGDPVTAWETMESILKGTWRAFP